MKWFSFCTGISLIAVCLLAFPTPTPAPGLGVFALGTLLLCDWAWEGNIRFAPPGPLATRHDEIAADFHHIEQARWRYLVALLASGAIAVAFGLTNSIALQTAVLIGGFALFGVVGYIGILKSRKRVSQEPFKG